MVNFLNAKVWIFSLFFVVNHQNIALGFHPVLSFSQSLELHS